MDLGLLLLRLTLGLTLAAHGAQKLFGWFGGHGLERTARIVETLGFQPGRRHALAAGVTETGGGLLLALGLLTPAAAAVIVAVMLVAGASAHVGRGFFITNGGYEYALVIAMVAVAVGFTGPGAFSLDHLLGYHFRGAWWGLSVSLVGAVGGAIQLAGRGNPSQRVSEANVMPTRN